MPWFRRRKNDVAAADAAAPTIEVRSEPVVVQPAAPAGDGAAATTDPTKPKRRRGSRGGRGRKKTSSTSSAGADAAEKDLYEKNARDLITLWGDRESGLHEYSCRQWAGLIKDFYKPRWQQYFDVLRHKMAIGDRMETTAFEKSIKDWEWKWVNSTGGNYPEEPVGDAVGVVKGIYKKYASRL